MWDMILWIKTMPSNAFRSGFDNYSKFLNFTSELSALYTKPIVSWTPTDNIPIVIMVLELF